MQKLKLVSLLMLPLLMAQAADSQTVQMPTQTDQPSGQMSEKDEIPHPFFTHMGVPEAVGVYSLRTAALASRENGHTDGDFAFHFETGLTDFIGIHVRNDRFLNMPRTEVMFQFAAFRTRSKMSGIAPLIEFEVPTRNGGGRVETLVGFTTALSSATFAWNSVLHYNPRLETVDGSGSVVFRATKRVFPVLELRTEVAKGERPMFSGIAGLKIRAAKFLVLGLGIEVPFSSRKDFTHQTIFQPDFSWSR